MDLFNSDEVLIGEDTFGKVSSPQSNAFKPWHKPRKQYIRDKQWLFQFKRLLGSRAYRSIDTVNYFGLPGGDLLDVNFIFDGVETSKDAKGKTFGFHGFINNESDHNKAQIELSKLLDKKHIDQRSKIDQFQFEDLQKTNSEAWSRVKNFGTYHFINLDFCNNVMSPETLVSIFYLLKHQIHRVADMPWLLCITTRLNRDSAKEGIIERFNKILYQYLGTDLLKSKIQECFSEVEIYIAEEKDLTSLESKELMNQVLQIGLVMWILIEALQEGCEVTLKSSFKYSVNLFDRESDMHSYVFSIEKKTKEADLLGLVQSESGKNKEVDFESCALQVLDKLSSSLDIDTHLENNQDDLEHYADEMIRLLNKCSYDTENYKDIMATEYGYEFNS
ncbi:hypothetical protein NRL14_15555 [Pseudoalteromonas sp. 20-92]|uniref:PP_RS20740 family protein n=1 Tax=Pseudoalteromonas sp. 20-92 TaxID=2969394 RepID=UPI0027AFA278|nr:hypothetical protein [Pseudoalteromonas sp. 20-92]MDQ2045146.1 hypothetical protein [Pseudoalteromonas sp. 20-92]